MLAFKTIVVPTDFSDDANAAIAQAVDLAKTTGARIHLVHVYHLPTYAGSPMGYTYPVDVFEDIRRHSAARLAEIEQKIQSDSLRVDSEVIEGPPSVRIVECAERENADLIVMGTRGLTGIKHVFLGSVAERTLRHASCPVMTVKSSATES